LILRHLFSILILPFMVVIIVPYWLLTTYASGTFWGSVPAAAWLSRSLGAILSLGGLALFAWCVGLFARVGQGTLAPWDPTRALVAVGPYRYVRNPMISGVALMLIGEAFLWGSIAVAVWAVVFILINHLYFVFLEEPGLEQRFGESYRAYKANVPRWIPRLKPGKSQ
jgi:protein-S-isoprenylcysteine O-methyltransferase Ste14